jgi:Carboxypeptidase regulatory-like domain
LEGHLGTLKERPLVLECHAPFWRTHALWRLYERMNQDLGGTRLGLFFDFARWSKPFLVAGSIVLIFSSLARSSALAQEIFSSTAHTAALPDAPQPAGSLSGTVLDTNRNVLQGARVTLADPSGSVIRTVDSGSNGEFAFTGVPPGVYKLTVTAPGMSTFTSTQIPLHAGEVRIVPPVTLSVSGGTTSVTVSGNKEELAEEQVRIAVQQRIGGVIPNFYSTYDWNAPPMEAKQKFQLSIRSIIDPVSFLIVAGIAGAEQYKDVFPAYGGGIEGYGKRYGAALANHVSGTLLGSCLPFDLSSRPTLLLQGEGEYPVARAVRDICRSDRQGR